MGSPLLFRDLDVAPWHIALAIHDPLLTFLFQQGMSFQEQDIMAHESYIFKPGIRGAGGGLGGSVVWRLPLAQGAILESPDQVPRRDPGMEPASPSSCVSLYVYHE